MRGIAKRIVPGTRGTVTTTVAVAAGGGGGEVGRTACAAQIGQRRSRECHGMSRKKAKRWFELARAVAEGKPPTSTAARVWRFTEHLARGGKPEGGAGSVLDPAFEYR